MTEHEIQHYEVDLDDEDDINIFDDPDWEDLAFPANIAEQYPGWHQLKITNFSGGTLNQINEWCKQNISHGRWKQVGWNSGCSYSVGIVVEHGRDAMMFRLRWN